MSPVLTHGKVSYKEFEGRCLSDWKKAWREVKEPQGDPVPRVYFYRNEEALHMQEIPFAWFSGRESKDVLFEVIAKLASLGNCSLVAITHTMMGFPETALTEAEAEHARATNTYPDRVLHGCDNLTELHAKHPELVTEMASVVIIDREVARGHSAEVLRKSARPPRLGTWYPGALAGGMMIEPIQAVMR